MDNLEQKINNPESEKSVGLSKGVQSSLGETLNKGNEERDFHQEILEIDNERIRTDLMYFFDNNCSKKWLSGEIAAYNEVKDKLGDEKYKALFDKLVSKRAGKVIPSEIKRQFKVYEELEQVEDPDGEKIISRYLDEGFPPDLVKEEYEVFVELKNYNYKDEELRNSVISCINRGARPKLVDRIFELVNDDEYSEKTKKILEDMLGRCLDS